MSRAAAASLVLALVLLAAPALAQDTTGMQLDHAPGFTFGSNVEGYLRLSTDVCDIKKTIGTDMKSPNYKDAKAIYVDGKNSKKADGTVRTLRELATKSYAGEPVFDLSARHFGSAAFMDNPISFAFAGDAPYTTVPQRNQTILKGLEAMQVTYLLHELDETVEKMKAKKLSPKDGAPHQLDETWAIYAGLTPECSLWGTANKRAAEFGTMQDCSTSKVNAGMAAAHRKMYAAAADGNIPAFQAAQKEAQRLLAITYIQATLKYAELMDKARAENNQEALEDEQAEANMFFRPIAPFVARANPGAAKKIQAVLTPGAAVPPNTLAIVKPALESTYAKLDIEPSDIGSYGSKQALGCVAKTSAGVAAAAGASTLVAAALAAVLLL